MRKRIMLLLACCLFLGGCGAPRITQEEYDAVVAEKDAAIAERDTAIAERDALENEAEKLGQIAELNEKVLEYQARIEEQYKHAKFILYVSGMVIGEDTESYLEQLDDLYNTTIGTIGAIKTLYESVDMPEGIDLDITTTMQAVDDTWAAWERFYETILTLENLLWGNQ